MGIREIYLAAREAAGPTFVADNPGTHFFFIDDMKASACVFCRRSEKWLRANSEEDTEFAPCTGDIRSE